MSEKVWPVDKKGTEAETRRSAGRQPEQSRQERPALNQVTVEDGKADAFKGYAGGSSKRVWRLITLGGMRERKVLRVNLSPGKICW